MISAASSRQYIYGYNLSLGKAYTGQNPGPDPRMSTAATRCGERLTALDTGKRCVCGGRLLVVSGVGPRRVVCRMCTRTHVEVEA